MKKLTSILVSKETYNLTPSTKRRMWNFPQEINPHTFVRMNLKNFGKSVVRIITPSKDETYKIVRRRK